MKNPIDVLDYAHQLEAAGVPKAQAEVPAQLLPAALGQRDFSHCEVGLKQEIRHVEDRLVARIETSERTLHAEIKSSEQNLLAELKLSEQKNHAHKELIEIRLSSRMDTIEIRTRALMEVLARDNRVTWWAIGLESSPSCICRSAALE